MQSQPLPFQLKLFLGIQLLFSTASSLSGIFVNVFLWKVNQDILTIAYFNMTLSGSIMLMMFPAGWIGRRFHAVWTLRTSMVLFSLFYYLIFYFREQAPHFIFLLGFLQGTAVAFYALAMHVIAYDHSQNNNRSRYFGWSSFFTTLGNMIPPLVSGWIITHYQAMEGYQVVFFSSLVLFAIAGGISLFLVGRGQKTRSSLLAVMRRGGRDWRNVQLANGIYGLHDGIMWFLLQLVAYWILKDEFHMGMYTTVGSIISLFAALYVGKKGHELNRARYFLIGAIGVGIGHLILSGTMSVTGYTIYILFVTIFTNFYSIPYSSTTFEVISRDPQSAERRIDYIVSREIPIGLGRLISVGLFAYMHRFFQDMTTVQLTIASLGLLYMGSWWLMSQVRPQTQDTGE